MPFAAVKVIGALIGDRRFCLKHGKDPGSPIQPHGAAQNAEYIGKLHKIDGKNTAYPGPQRHRFKFGQLRPPNHGLQASAPRMFAPGRETAASQPKPVLGVLNGIDIFAVWDRSEILFPNDSIQPVNIVSGGLYFQNQFFR